MFNQESNREFAAAANTAEDANIFDQTREFPSLRHDGVLRQCAWCRRISVGLDVWVETEEAIQILPFISLKTPDEVTHGVCPACFDSFLSEKQTARIG